MDCRWNPLSSSFFKLQPLCPNQTLKGLDVTDQQVGKISFGSCGTQVVEIKIPPSATGPWRPMSEAPKDGKTLLLEWSGGGSYSVGFWDEDTPENNGWVIEGFEDYLDDSDFQRFALIKP
jgi:hypothetical protein